MRLDYQELGKRIAEDFMEWQSHGDFWYDKDGRRRDRIEDFDPWSSAHASTLVLNEIERRDWSWKWSYDRRFGYEFLIWHDTEKIGTSENKHRYVAICLAVSEAIAALKEATA